MITYHRAKTDEELKEILALQHANLFANVPDHKKLSDGFVTLKHDLEILKKMNTSCAHCIAKKEGKIIGYALSMLQNFRNDIPILIPMFKELDNLVNTQKLSSNYIAMGQICIDKNQRKKGIFKGLYQYMMDEMKNDFDAIITEVDTKNTRSSNAHKAVGFTLLKEYTTNNQLWEIIVLNL